MTFRRVLLGAIAALLIAAAPAAAQGSPSCMSQGAGKVSQKGPHEILPQEVVEVPSGNGMQLGRRPVGPVELSFGSGASFMRFASPRPKAKQFFTPPEAP